MAKSCIDHVSMIRTRQFSRTLLNSFIQIRINFFCSLVRVQFVESELKVQHFVVTMPFISNDNEHMLVMDNSNWNQLEYVIVRKLFVQYKSLQVN